MSEKEMITREEAKKDPNFIKICEGAKDTMHCEFIKKYEMQDLMVTSAIYLPSMSVAANMVSLSLHKILDKMDQCDVVKLFGGCNIDLMRKMCEYISVVAPVVFASTGMKIEDAMLDMFQHIMIDEATEGKSKEA